MRFNFKRAALWAVRPVRESLKIVGREASPFKKLASVRMVRAIVDQVRAASEKLVTIERAKSLRGDREHCDSGYMCYYKVEP